MLKGFKDFLMRGNVIDLAVAVVVGSAFTAIVTAFTNSVIKPVIALAGSTSTRGLGFRLDPAKEATFIDLSTAINAIITFFITAGVVYFLFVLPMQKLQERRKKGQEDGPSEATDVELLAEIRNLLRREQGMSAIDGARLASDDEDGAEKAGSTNGNGNGKSDGSTKTGSSKN